MIDSNVLSIDMTFMVAMVTENGRQNGLELKKVILDQNLFNSQVIIEHKQI